MSFGRSCRKNGVASQPDEVERWGCLVQDRESHFMVACARARPSSQQMQSEERQHQLDTEPILSKVTVWRNSSFAHVGKMLLGNITLTNEIIWTHGWLHSFCTSRYLTHLSVAESRARRRDRCRWFLERYVARTRRQDVPGQPEADQERHGTLNHLLFC